DVARTLAGRTGRGPCRAVVVAADVAQAAAALAALAEQRPHPALVLPAAARPARTDRPVWVFSGYGSQWAGMGRRLLLVEPAFAAAVDRLEPLLLGEAGLSLRQHLGDDVELTRPGVVQPVLFGVQLALAELWRSYGVEPATVIGHSMGEVAAAVVAGALTEQDGARVIAVRSRLLDRLSGGAMAAVGCPADEVGRLTADLTTVQVAVHASPEQSVVTGTGDEIEELLRRVAARGLLARSLGVAGAGHSAQVDPLLEPLTAQLTGLAPGEPRVPCYGTVLDDPRQAPSFDAAYWAANLRRPVRFEQAVRAAAQDGHRSFLEVSPHPTQLLPLADTLRAVGVPDPVLLAALRRDPDDDALAFRRALAAALAEGVPLDPRALHPGGRVVDLPSPGWQHQVCWVGAPPPVPRGPAGAAPPPGVDTLGRLTALLADVLGRHPGLVDPAVPLTGLGLDSLTAARLLTRVRHEFGTDVPPGELLRGATLRTLAARLDAPPTGEGREAPATGVLPRDAAERRVAQTWHSVSGTAAPGVEDRLPVDGLARVAERLGLDVAAARSGPPTLAALASLLRPRLETPVTGPVRAFRETGGRAPLFLVHPAGGSSAVYRTLAERLGADQPCYGLERLADLTEVGERAAACAAAIRDRVPGGPWAVGGWSYGGLVAQHTARLLARHGTVTALVLIDSVLPLLAPGLTEEQLAHRRLAGFAAYVERTYGRPLPLPYDRLAALDPVAGIDLVLKELAQAVDLSPAVLEHQRTSYLDLRSGERHRPRRYAGRTLLYRATEPAPHTVPDPRYRRTDEALGWDAHCPDLTVTPLPGHHLELLDPPLVDALAALLDRALAPHPPISPEPS
ncbi:acyltransferase domain-containing protein, partial [Kitasatospora sp. NPDC058965]|uniref:acyltransferase domain-containing protein n=1 Tax=Kitasatospora sp. NPDC058965 TaxID=3346682 RepID=UPI0036C2908F